MEINNKSRELWPDVIRIFAIFGVIALHTLGTYPSFSSPYIFKIFETSVPIFVMLSGALLLGKAESYLSFFKKRSVKVLIPWIVWTFIYMIFLYYLKDEYVISNYFNGGIVYLNNWAKFFFIQFFTGLWFLPLIFGIYLITPPLRIFIKSAKELDIFYLLSLWFVFISFLPWVFSSPLFPEWLPSFIYAPIQYSGYFVLGYVIAKKIKQRELMLPLWHIIPISALIVVLPISNFLEPSTIFASILLFVYLFSFSNNIDKKISPKAKSIIYKISSASMGIYIVHSFFTYCVAKFLSMDQMLKNSGFIYTVIIFLISFLTIYILQKIPIVKKIVP